MRTPGRYLGYGAVLLAFPLVQVLAPLVAGPDLPELAYYLMLTASGLACLAAMAALRWPSYDRRTMACLALGLACWVAGMGYAIARSGTEQNLISTYVLFVSFGLPLLYAAVATRDEPTTPARRVVDGALLILLVILCYLGVRDLSDGNGFLKNEDMVWVVVAFDVENVFLFLTFLIRTFAAQDEKEYRFFRLTTIFLSLYALSAGIHNHDELYPDLPVLRQLADVLPTLPFAALLCLLHHGRTPRAFDPAGRLWARQLAAGFAPGLLLAAIFALSLGIRDSQGMFGRIVMALAMLCYVVRVVQTQFWFAATRDRLSDALTAVERVSLLDELTGIPNRRAFEQAFAERVREASRDGKPISALMIDVDLFKTFNDTRGHPEGDIALKAVARLLAGALRRPADFIARYGGEEFIALLPLAPAEGAQVVARRMTRAVYDALLEYDHGIDGRVTVSIGVATAMPPDTAGLVREADQALYLAKSAGRNRYVALGETEAALPG